jgi:hypothetical protein
VKNTTIASTRSVSARVRMLLLLAAAVDLLLGLLFLFGPELPLQTWPTPVPSLLLRFIGAIVLSNAVGIWVGLQLGTWEGLRALFWVGVVYGGLAFLALVYHLLFLAAPAVFWAYPVADAVYLVAIARILWIYERSSAILSAAAISRSV